MSENESRFTRISVLGTGRNADVVIPSHAPLDLVMPQLAQVLGEDIRQNHALTRLTGGPLRPSSSLAQEGVTDGTILQLTRLETTPPSPTVFDISEAAEATPVAGRWSGPVRRQGLSLVAGLAFALALLPFFQVSQLGYGWAVVGAALGLVLLGSVFAWLGSRPAGRVLAGCGVALGLVSTFVAEGIPLPWLWPLVIGLLAAIGTSARPTRWIAALASLIVVAGAWFALLAVSNSAFLAGGILGTACLLVVGIMPQIALGASGVFSAQRTATEIARATAEQLVVRAHDVLAGAVTVLGLTTAVCVAQMLLDPAVNAWALGLAAALTVGAALRQRPFPLAPEKLALWAVPLAALAALGSGLTPLPDGVHWVSLAALLTLAVALLVAAHARVPEHIEAQLRQFGNTIETLALVVTIPLAVGMFGTYSLLLGLLG
nr:hypothetical protein [Actinomycetales bacterium]